MFYRGTDVQLCCKVQELLNTEELMFSAVIRCKNCSTEELMFSSDVRCKNC